MTTTLIHGLAVIGGLVVLAATITLTLFIIVNGLYLLEHALDTASERVFYKYGGVANKETGEYTPPPPPYDRLRFEISRLKHYTQRIMQRLGLSPNTTIITGMNKDAMYDQRHDQDNTT